MSSGALTGYPGAPDTTTLYMQQTANIAASPAAYPTLYPSVDNRYLTATDYFAAAGYRTALAGTYYPSEYHAALQNGYLDPSTRISGLASYDQKLSDADKLYTSSAAAYMELSDPRLCHPSALRLGTPTPDNKNDVWTRGSNH